MAVEVTTPAPVAHDEWRDRRWRLTGLLVAMMALTTAALLVATGTRPASYGDLLSDVAGGKVSEVEVVGPDVPKAGDSVELRWKVLADVLDQYAVVEVGGNRGYDAWRKPVFASSGDPLATLRSINSGIVLTPASSSDGPSTSFMDWRAPGAVVLLALATWLAVLLLIIGGPEPWRATRWAWGWAWLLTGPLGSVAYLLLGGPLGTFRPRDRRRRLTGGWAFLAAMIVPASWVSR